MTDEIEAVKEVASATKEVAKTTGKAIDAASDAGRFLARVMGDFVTDGFGLITDRLKYYRFERAVMLAEKTQKRLEAKGITNIRSVPPKIALPLIENATIEDDDHLHTLWANLLASAMDADGEQIERKFVSALSDLTSDDAYTLAKIYDDWKNPERIKSFSEGTLTYGECVDGMASHNSISIITLYRLGFVAPSFVEFNTYEPPGHNRYGDYGPAGEPLKVYGDLEVVILTDFGETFCKAVIAIEDTPN